MKEASPERTRLLRPHPVAPPAGLVPIDGNARYRDVETWLTQGRPVCITDTYGTALTLYGWLKRNVQRRQPVTDYRTQRLFRELLWRLTRPLLVPIQEHRLRLKRAPAIPWLEELYPEQDSFLLPLTEVLGLNGSWQWYRRGVRYCVLEHPLHPFYGVHFTPRGEHLELLGAYLDTHAPVPERAVDVGTGAGPVTLLLLEHGVGHVQATDMNPNALRSVHDDLVKIGWRERVELVEAEGIPEGPPVDLIMSNPPWLPGPHRATVDPGSYYTAGFFPRLFAQAFRRLRPGGRLVVLFSNLAEITGLSTGHPVRSEVEKEGRFRLVDFTERAPTAEAGRTVPAWRRELRARERLELWELTPM